ncbi:unnamed protein product [Lactuca virosa]|uniref:Bromo domain-containing protein n=1 Tax=Lactuca virosa TaxID=75947 RepID=A0AAU9PM74_9ASTR|nr:unnamed protein product [Lactuca virosa]
MKRKRGKKGNSKSTPKAGITEDDSNIDNLSGEDESGPDDNQDTEKDETSSRMDIETPSSTGTDQPEKPPAVSSTGVTDKPVGRLVYNRVKVKIKSSKALEPQITSSDAHTHSDTDKSSQHIGLEKQIISDKVEDSANSAPENNVGAYVNQAKKTGSIKIKSSKGFSSSLSHCNTSGVSQTDKTHQKEPVLLSRDSVYNKQELNASLEVIKKIMKMDAAEPFNAPVNPVALGIPDYFDVIKTPMDFGTICSNLEKGLYNEHDLKDGNISSHGKSSKSSHSKHKSRKRQGVKRHKDDCLCAICIMMRRRLEREQIMNPGNDQMETDDGLVQVKVEGASMVGSFNGDDTSSSTDNSQNQDADGDMEDKGEEVKMENTMQSSKQEEKEKEKEMMMMTSQKNYENAIAEQTEKFEDVQMAEAGDAVKDDDDNTEEKLMHHEDDTSPVENQKPKDLGNASEKAKLYETLQQRYENPMVLELCNSLFPENPKSLWAKAHSLLHHHKSPHNHTSSIAAAIATFMK